MKKWGLALLGVLKENWISVGLFVGVFAIFLFGLKSAQAESSAENLRIVEQSIGRAIITCYAIEGMYPSELAYLEQAYGLYIDESQYYVQYQVFASNIMPEVTVIEVAP